MYFGSWLLLDQIAYVRLTTGSLANKSFAALHRDPLHKDRGVTRYESILSIHLSCLRIRQLNHKHVTICGHDVLRLYYFSAELCDSNVWPIELDTVLRVRRLKLVIDRHIPPRGGRGLFTRPCPTTTPGREKERRRCARGVDVTVQCGK